MHRSRYLHQLQRMLPVGAEVYFFDPSGTLHILTRGHLESLNPLQCEADRANFLRFIDEGHFARYFIGSAATSDALPSNATYKLGMMRPHSAFTPHAHGAEHFVLSLGYASCSLYDQDADQVAHVRLLPGAMLRIPALMPHSFNNRAHDPLHLVIANTGMGLDHEAYAITVTQAEVYAQHAEVEVHTHSHAQETEHSHQHPSDVDYASLARALRRLEQEMPMSTTHTTVTWRERIAALLHKLAWILEQH